MPHPVNRDLRVQHMSEQRLVIAPLASSESLKTRAYVALKAAISDMDIYAPDAELRLDERGLSSRFGVSRTPLREALALLDREGLISVVSRRGIFIVRKSRAELLDMITVWAALEGMAARLACKIATPATLAHLREAAAAVETASEHGAANIRFHQALLHAGGNTSIDRIADDVLFHVRVLRRHTRWDAEQCERSRAEHRAILTAIEMGDADTAERLVREHTFDLRERIARSLDHRTAPHSN